jgi:hypothetical protein
MSNANKMRKPFDKAAASQAKRRGEWVDLDCGSIYALEMTVAESVQLAEKAARPSIDPRGGLDPGESVLWQILLGCYVDDSPDSPRLFSQESAADIKLIYSLPFAQFQLLMAAINRVNGRDAEEAELMRDFSAARGAVAS